jgi:RHS repeat-associated protein
MPHLFTPDYYPVGILCSGGHSKNRAMPHWCWVSDYSPFGSIKPATSWVADSMGYRYAFNGKELDPLGMGGGGSTYDYGFRIYNAQVARFLSVDPLTASYPWYTPYQFAGNKPIWAIDLDGLEEYRTSSGELIGKYGDNTEIRVVFDDYIHIAQKVVSNDNLNIDIKLLNDILYNRGTVGVFNDPDQLAVDWTVRYNSTSIKINREMSSWVYMTRIDNKLFFSYTEPVIGEEALVKNSFTQEDNKRLFGSIHSHGAYDPNFRNNEFSKVVYDKSGSPVGGDIYFLSLYGMTGYLATPNGSLQNYTVANGVKLLRCDMPSDPDDPDTDQNIVPLNYEFFVTPEE